MKLLNSYPKIYIIILNYNGWADTIECLESVLKNDYPNYQVIVVDNNSPNNSIGYIKAWAEGKLDVWVKPDHPLRHLSFSPVAKPIPYVYYSREESEKGGNKDLENKLNKELPEGITTKYPLIFIQTGGNLGFAGGNNVAIRYVLNKDDFKYILLLNNDTVVEKNFLSNLVNTAIENNFGITGCRINYYYNPHKIWFNGGNLNEWFGRATHIQKEINKTFSEVSFITGCCMLIKKEVIKKIGLLDESYFMYVEDLDYTYRTMEKGFKLAVVHTSVIYHKVGASGGGEITPFSAYWYYKNSLKFRKKMPIIKKIISISFYFSRIPYITIKWYFKNKQIIKSMFVGIKDALSKN